MLSASPFTILLLSSSGLLYSSKSFFPNQFHSHFRFFISCFVFLCIDFSLFIHHHEMQYIPLLIGLVHDKNFPDKSNLSNLDLKVFSRWEFQAKCKAVVKLAETGRKRSRRRYIAQCLCLNSCLCFHKIAGWAKVDADASSTSGAGIAIALYCQENEHVDHMVSLVFLSSALSSGFVNRASYIQMIRETRPRRSSIA